MFRERSESDDQTFKEHIAFQNNFNFANNLLADELNYKKYSIDCFNNKPRIILEKEISKEKKHRSTVRRIFKIIKAAFDQMQKQKQKVNSTEMIMIEWKELARRFDYLMFFLALIVICITPVILFGKFFVRDLVTESHLKAPCGCDHSFVKNI